ncbi:Fungalysin metallopeptidase-domain-containing protein [Mycena vulgaris]|nr:Fungalysin metallopeptidase-domain-containing protein [Mycena vulgaris]
MRNTFFTSVLLAVLYAASLAGAAPTIVNSSKHATHSKRQLRSGRTLTTYHPASTFETYGEGVDHSLRKREGVTLQESSVAWVQNKLGLQENSVAWHSGYTAGHAKHAYVKQSRDGIFFANAVANVAFNNDDKVVSFGSSFVNATSYAPSVPSLDVKTAIASAEATLSGSHAGMPDAQLKYFAKQDGSAALVHSFQVGNDADGTWYEALVDAHSGQLLSVVDYVAHASYLVLPITKQQPAEGFEILVDPQDLLASPQGWHFAGQSLRPQRIGNNAVAFKDDFPNQTEQSAPDLVFNYPADPNQEPTTPGNLDAARVNAFYVVNTVHDIAYRYGFTEEAFNFQFDNLGHGGTENDMVLISVQDASGTNNANFATPPDGQSGQMRMFLFTKTVPSRDGAFDNDIVVHEATHGITNRMTGGGTGTCLQSLEAGGLGEGWSDAMAEWTEQKDATIQDFVTGVFVDNSTQGGRSHPYSTSGNVNPLTYASVGQLREEHDIGEVWANMLHNVYAALVEAHGFSTTAATNPDGPEGNVVFLHLMLDALALQPCQPTFVSARDAWIQADQNRYGGANRCTVFAAFASRGLGANADASFTDDFSVPADCVAQGQTQTQTQRRRSRGSGRRRAGSARSA